MSHPPHAAARAAGPLPRARAGAWLRVLVLVLALLVPGTHTVARAVPATAVSREGGGPAAEYDLPDTALRPPVRSCRRPAVPSCPAPPPAPAPARAVRRPAPVPPEPAHGLLALRSVVLRC
ncbi:hypothetical protein GCM10010129_47870 [Streptomyces fumigatiscleroticus]|nr:hypothetical protein GCM10010129_47870 [Streptomyces fumigatiscleroticus]